MKAVLIVIIVLILGGTGVWYAMSKEKTTTTSSYSSNSSSESASNTNTSTNTSMATAEEQSAMVSASPTATIETSLGTITMRFFTEAAPELTKNFIELAKTGYYDGLTFHRIIPGFVAQGGDPLGTGTGGHSYKGEGQGLADEPGALALKHFKGAVAWAKSSLPNSIGSQFYIALEDIPQLDGGYSVFGQVVEGLDVIEKLGKVATDASDKPTTPVVMTKVTITE